MSEQDDNINKTNFSQENSENISKEKVLDKSKFKKVKFKTKNKINKKSNKKKGIHVGIGSIILILFCAFLLVVATFLQLNITHLYLPMKFFTGEHVNVTDFLYSIKYIPQIPVALFIVGLLGRKFGFISILIYIITGLFFMPVFALGGGWRYVFEYGFGYLFAFLPAAIILGTILRKDYSYKNVAKAVFCAVLTIHFIGIIYMTMLAILRHAGTDFIISWISAQSGIKILYDLVLSYLMVLLSKYARVILWFYL